MFIGGNIVDVQINILTNKGDKMKTYYIPETKKELIDWLSNFYCRREAKWLKMPKKQLYAIYFSIRGKHESL